MHLINLSWQHGSETEFFHRFYGYHCNFANLNTISATDSAKKLGFSALGEQVTTGVNSFLVRNAEGLGFDAPKG
jgi:hypothetical protein